MSSGKVKFKVSKEWVQLQNVDVATIALKKYSGTWYTIASSKTEEDAFYYKYEATVTSFGSFAIVAQQKATESITQNASLEQPLNGSSPDAFDNSSWRDTVQPSNLGSLLLYTGIIIVMIVLLIVYFAIHARGKIQSERVGEEKQKIQELKDFIKSSQEKGVSKEEIRKKLVDAGWNTEIVNIYLK